MLTTIKRTPVNKLKYLSLSLIFITSIAIADQNSTISVPLQVIPVSKNNYKVGITISVAGGPPTQLTFDTGGSGLHIFKSQVGSTNITYTNQHIKSAFASGLVYEGTIAMAPVTIGSVTTAPIPVLVIEKAYCLQDKPNCGAGSDPNNPSPIMGQFYGELGASMLPETHGNNPAQTLYTPFRALPDNYGTGYIIQNLSPNGTGSLILGLTPQNSAGFNQVQLPKSNLQYPDGTTAYNDKGLNVNYTIDNMNQVMRTAFDTGGDIVVNFFTGGTLGYPARQNHITPNNNFNAYLANGFNWQFTTSNHPGRNFIKIEPQLKGKGGPYVNTGISFFFDYDVMYNFKDGKLGFMPQ